MPPPFPSRFGLLPLILACVASFALAPSAQARPREVRLGDVRIALGDDNDLAAGDLVRTASIDGVALGSGRAILNVALADALANHREGVNHGAWTFVRIIQRNATAAEAVFEAKAAPGVRLHVAFATLSRQVDAWNFSGFRYCYRIEGWNRPGAEIVENTRWVLEGDPAKTTHVIASIYGPQLYRHGVPGAPVPWDGPTFPGSDEKPAPEARPSPSKDAVNTWAGGRLHSRFGKLDGFEFQVSDSGHGLLISLDEPALHMAGHRAGRDEPALVVTDHAFLDGTPPTGVWRDVLLRRNGVRDASSVSVGNFWLRVAWAERERIRSLAGVTLPDAGLMVATGPRFKLAEPLLPRFRELGVEWVSVGPIWESSATEGGSFSSMSVWRHRVAEKWGGIDALRSFCAAADAEGIKVLAWFPFVHVSKESPWTRREGFTGERLAGGDNLVPLNLKNPAVRQEVLAAVRLVRDAGVRGLWLDAYHSFGLEVVTEEGGARLPQVREVLAMQRELQSMDITQFIEAWTPFGLSSHGVIGRRLSHYERWPFFGLTMAPYADGPHGGQGGLDLKAIDYGRFLAMRSSLFVGLHMWNETADIEPLGRNGDLAALGRRFALIRPRMHRPLGWLEGFHACVWEDANGQRVMWSCVTGPVAVPTANALRDLETGKIVRLENGAFPLGKDRIYEWTQP